MKYEHPSLPNRSGGDYAQGDSQTERPRSFGGSLFNLIKNQNQK